MPEVAVKVSQKEKFDTEYDWAVPPHNGSDPMSPLEV